MTETFRFFMGVDLGSRLHSLRLIDSDGNSVGQFSIEHAGGGMQHMLDWLVQNHATPEQTAGALEAPRGPVVDALLEHGYAMFSINPKQLDRFRDRFSVGGAKDDPRDARVLADSLRTDIHCFRRLGVDPPARIRLRELSRTEHSHQQDLRRTANQLWALLQRYFPGPLQLCPAADEPWLWHLLARVKALPDRAAKLTPKARESFLRQHRIRRFCAADLTQHLAQPLPLAPGVAAAAAEQVLLLLPRLHLLHQQLSQLAQRSQKLLDDMSQPAQGSEHRTVQILRSIPGVGRIGAAAMLAEAGKPLTTGDYHTLRALCGLAPITRQSGKTKIVVMRRACNHRLRNALFHCANGHMQRDPRAHQLYLQHRQAGQSHGRALRTVGDRLLSLIVTLVRKGKDYDPTLRQVASPNPSS